MKKIRVKFKFTANKVERANALRGRNIRLARKYNYLTLVLEFNEMELNILRDFCIAHDIENLIKSEDCNYEIILPVEAHHLLIDIDGIFVRSDIL